MQTIIITNNGNDTVIPALVHSETLEIIADAVPIAPDVVITFSNGEVKRVKPGQSFGLDPTLKYTIETRHG